MALSTSRVEVVRVGKILPHPNADKLELTYIFGGYPVVIGKGEWHEGDLGAYVPPDNLVPLDRSEFAFLEGRLDGKKEINGKRYHLIRTVKLRKETSMGLLFRPENILLKEGDNIADTIGVLHYEPPQQGGHLAFTRKGFVGAERTPFIKPPTYDVDSLRRYGYAFTDGEPVYISEKIHGCNARYTWEDRGIFDLLPGGIRFDTWYIGTKGIRRLPREARYLRVGSRNLWKRFDPRWKTVNEVTDVWWEVALRHPEISHFLEIHPGVTLYGEIYGKVQDIHYGIPNDVRLAAFDIRYANGTWAKPYIFLQTCKMYGIQTVPNLALGELFDFAKIVSLADGPSHVEGADCIREGVVVKPMEEREERSIGRLVLKLVGERYYERS